MTIFNIMACSSCKNKSNYREQIIESTKSVENGIVWFSVIWTLLALYGLYSLIRNIF
jgi:hypothetical protein